jgi:hypothetical protein
LTIATAPPNVFTFLELTPTFIKYNSSDKRKSISKLIKARACQHCTTATTAGTGGMDRLSAEFFVLTVITPQQKFKLITLSITFQILPHNTPRTLFSNTLKQCYSPNVRYKAAQSHKTC